MDSKRCVVIGISGATCSGKTTLAAKINNKLKNSIVIHQDNYFLPPDDPRHTKIPELNHCNWEILTSMDMKRMLDDVRKLIADSQLIGTAEEAEGRIIILDGYLLYECKDIADLCNLKFYLTLTREQCWERRKNRSYDPPDVPGYFDRVVWPEYLKQLEHVRNDANLSEAVTFLDGSQPIEKIFQTTITQIKRILS